MRKGQPIETAPKDETWILTAHENGYVNIMQFCSAGYWRSTTSQDDLGWQPTRWWPLPAPSKAQNAP